MNHLFDSLNSAARLVVRQPGYVPGCINCDRWALTYRTDAETVREALKIAENGSRRLPEEEAASAPPATPQPEDIDE